MTAPCTAALGARLGVGSAEGGGEGAGGRRLLGLCLAAQGCGDGDWGRLWQLQLLPWCGGVMVTRPAAVGLLRTPWVLLSAPVPIKLSLLYI